MKGSRAAAGWILSLALAGCAVGPDYHGPPPEEYTPPGKFKNASGANGRWKVGEPADQQTRGSWWTIFHEPQLNDLVNQALAGNQDLRVAASHIAEARSLDRVAASQFYPEITFAGSATRQRITNTGPLQRGQLVGPSPLGASAAPAAAMPAGMAAAGATAAPVGSSSSSAPVILAEQPLTTTYNLFRAPLELSWELDLFGRVRRTYEASRAQRQGIERDYENTALIVAANVAVNYFALRSLDAEAVILDRAIATRREALRIAEERLQAGLTSELDVTRARADLASNEADSFALARTRGQVENALATLIGRPASLVRLTRNPLPAGSVPPHVPAALPSQLLERRPDVAEAERQLVAANAQIGVAKAAFFPVIRLTGEGGFESADLGLLFNWESRIWRLGPSVTLPIFEGGRNVANLGAATARYDEAVGRYRGQVLTAFQEIENALNDLHQLAGQSEADQRALTAALRSLELAREQYAKGQVNFLDVLDAERNALADERVVAELAGQRMQATVALVKALGGGWR
jgi:multidrug efflux system outer membrane protein